MSARTFKLIGAAGVTALALGTAIGPAVAAGEDSASVAYTCGTPAGPATPSVVYAIDAAPASMVAGQTVSLPTSAQVTLDATTTGLAAGLFKWVQFSSKLTTTPSATKAGLNLTIPKSPLGNGAGGTTVATATGKTLLKASKAGTYTVKLGDFGKVHLAGFDAAGDPVATNQAVDFPTPNSAFTACTNDDGVTTVKDGAAAAVTVAVKKDGSKTATKASYNAKKDVAKGTATVAGAKYKLAGTGKVTFTLKKGSKTIGKAITAKLKKGKATASFKNVKKKGSYTIVTKYAGDAALKGSSGKATFKVK